MFFGYGSHLAVGILSLVILLLGRIIWQGFRSRDAFKEAADALGISWSETEAFAPGECMGTIDGDTVRIFIEKVGQGSLERQLTAVEVDLVPPLDLEFEIGKENIVTRLFRRAGMHDVEFDDPAFDKIYRIKCEDHVAIRRLFTSDVRAALVLLAKGSDDLIIRPEMIRWEAGRRVFKSEELIRAAHAAISAARGMRNAS